MPPERRSGTAGRLSAWKQAAVLLMGLSLGLIRAVRLWELHPVRLMMKA